MPRGQRNMQTAKIMSLLDNQILKHNLEGLYFAFTTIGHISKF